MRPTPRGIIRGAAALSMRYEPVTFTAITRWNSCRLHSCNRAVHGMPARLTRRRPEEARVDLLIGVGHRGFGRDVVGTDSSPEWPASWSSFSTPGSPAALISMRATCQPFSASIRAVTRPIPPGPPAPVTTAVRGSGIGLQRRRVHQLGWWSWASFSGQSLSVDQVEYRSADHPVRSSAAFALATSMSATPNTWTPAEFTAGSRTSMRTFRHLSHPPNGPSGCGALLQ